MGIPEAQLETWSKQGSITQSASTYNSIRGVLDDSGTPYYPKNYKIFLQGSYGNDTNIYAESDVDIVIQLNSAYLSDLSQLNENEKAAFETSRVAATYSHDEFKSDVVSTLVKTYGDAVKVGEKAVNIAAGGNRRKADVITAVQFRRFYKFNGVYDQKFVEGICFFTTTGQQIVNYPKQHSANLTTKHQATGSWLKPMVRIVKNLRSRLVDEKMIEPGLAPSYYVEGLLYNVPADKFGGNYVDSFVNVFNWIHQADRTKFLCANEQYYLLNEYSPVTWRTAKCDAFIAAAIKLWNEW